jgi:low affinity Fe/Cu permease
MAFLFACMVLLPIARFPLMANLLINTAIATITLSLVLILAYIHGKDIRALKARLDEFAAELEASSSAQPQEKLTATELRHIRMLLSEQASEADDEVRRANRDKRPSLF